MTRKIERSPERGVDRTPGVLPPGAVAVVFTSRRTAADPAGYAVAATAMDAEAARQPGYLGMVSARDEDGFGITISYWASEADALDWRAHAGRHMMSSSPT